MEISILTILTITIISGLVGMFFIYVLDIFFVFFTKHKKIKQIKKNEIKSKIYLNKLNAENKLQVQVEKNKLEEKNLNNKKINEHKKKWLKEKEEDLNKYEIKIKNKINLINSEEEKLEIKYKNIEKERKSLIKKLEEIASLSTVEAEKELFKNIELKQKQKLNKLIKEKKIETEKNIKELTNNLISNSIERYSTEYISSKTITKLNLGNENFKGKIIGKEGRNIKKFEEISGVDIILENDSNIIKLSCFNPIRREIAYRALKKLVEDGRIQPQRIKDFLEIENTKVNEIIKDSGLKTIEELKIFDIHPELINLIGKLKYRTSYGQNILEHSIEVAKFSGALASKLGLDEKLATRAGLLHDIGKSLDYEIERSHVQLGVEVAQKYQENDIIINTIHSHHGDIPANNIYALLVSAADTLSAARPGARDNVHEDYIRRMKTIEEVCNNIIGVKKCYAVKSGRIILVFVDPLTINDYELEKIIETIGINLKAKLKIPGDVLIKVIREMVITKII